MPGPNRDTPAMRQYDAFKCRYPDCVLFFRMGDFYEMFDDDALTCHRALGITLTQRTEGIPMAGVPYHSVENYLRRMIDQGYRVAVCDQVQDPREVKGSAVIERAVTRVLTPGTLVDEALLRDDAPNHLAAVAFEGTGDDPAGRVGVAVVELSTGAFTLLDCRAADLVDELARRHVSELMFCPTADNKAPPRTRRVLDLLRVPGTPRPSWHFRRNEALEAVLAQFKVATVEGFGLRVDDPALPAAGVILRYLLETQAMDTAHLATSEGSSSGSASAMRLRAKSLAHLQPPRREPPEDGRLLIDAAGLRALEVEATLRSSAAPGNRGTESDGSLLGIFARQGGPSSTGGFRGCATAMGRRLLRDWLCRPSRQIDIIRARHNSVEALATDPRRLAALSAALEGVQDIPRIGARVGLGRATPRDLVALARSLQRLKPVREAVSALEGGALKRFAEALDPLEAALAPVADEIARVCVDDPPANLRDGGLIRDRIDSVIDECRALQKDSGEWLAQYQARLVSEHDLPSLKVGFNKIFGYYIELPSAQSKRAPAAFTRKQTLKNAERYITPDLKAYEDKVLSAADRAVQREGEMFFQLCTMVSHAAAEAAALARVFAELDVTACFAAQAVRRGWTRPTMTDHPVLNIEQGRHPVLEVILGEKFVANDLVLGTEAPRHEGTKGKTESEADAATLALITGPNMAGKSTFIRQTALITLLAHAGSFVPARAATIGVTDRIFTRIGADDALHAGQSTFMVEMIETASILHHATPHSLIILDEIGRGTSTLDGLSLAWAIAEHLAGSERAAKQQSSNAANEEAPGAAGAVEVASGDAAVIAKILPAEKKRSRRAPTPAPSHAGAPRTLFATHYHELTDLESRLPGRVKNLQVAVREWEGDIVFLHRIIPGRASRSYGVHVARLAGLPAPVVTRAETLLESLSVNQTDGAADDADRRQRSTIADASQLQLFTEFVPHPAVDALRTTNLDTLTPLQAFDALRELKKMIADGAKT
ncbi:MAG: DNA mismatch repair protein MutS [Phycisphaerales bacterium]